MSAVRERPHNNDREHGPVFWIALVVGGAIMVNFGLKGVWRDLHVATTRLSFAKWVVGADLVNDLLVLPLACAVAWAVSRFAPPRLRAPLLFGLFATAVALFVAYNPLRGSAAFKHNATVQPLDYTTATLTVVGVVWVLAFLWGATSTILARQRVAAASETQQAEWVT